MVGCVERGPEGVGRTYLLPLESVARARGGRNDPMDAESGSEHPEPVGDRAQSLQFPCLEWLRKRRHLAKRWTGGDEQHWPTNLHMEARTLGKDVQNARGGAHLARSRNAAQHISRDVSADSGLRLLVNILPRLPTSYGVPDFLECWQHHRLAGLSDGEPRAGIVPWMPIRQPRGQEIERRSEAEHITQRHSK